MECQPVFGVRRAGEPDEEITLRIRHIGWRGGRDHAGQIRGPPLERLPAAFVLASLHDPTRAGLRYWRASARRGGSLRPSPAIAAPATVRRPAPDRRRQKTE